MAFMYQEPDPGFTCFWRITNFNITSTSLNSSYNSQTFKIPMLSSSSWHLGLEHRCRDSLGLYLYKEVENNGNSNIDIQMSILTSSGWRTRFCHFFKFKPGGRGNGTAVLVDWKRYFSRNKHVLGGCVTVSCHMSNGATCDKYEQCFLVSNMTFSGTLRHLPVILEFCDLEPKHLINFPTPRAATTPTDEFCDSIVELVERIRYTGNEVETKSTQTENTDQNYMSNNTGDLLKLFKDKRFQYITLRTPSKDFAIHKALLCARSPVFNALFQRNVKENDGVIVDIDDVDSDTLSLLLQFLHMESIPINDLEWDAVLKLYYAADKYQIEQLKKECCSYLKKNSTDENVCDASILEDMNQDPELQRMHENSGEKREVNSCENWCF